MNITKGLDLIKSFEGCILYTYDDYNEKRLYKGNTPKGTPTIGWGMIESDYKYSGVHVWVNKTPYTITQKVANESFEKLIKAKYVPLVDKFQDKYKWNENQYNAMLCFVYNIGSLDQLTAKGTRTNAEIAKKILDYNKTGGKEVAGLTRRRTAERDLFITPMPPTKVLPKLPVDGKTTYWRIGDGKDTRTTAYDVKQIKAIQTAMNELGIKDEDGKKLGLNGYYGVKTASSVANFQKKYKLTPNGKFGNLCLEVLKELGYK